MRIKKRILFAGAYGIENAGDDLPLIVLCENLRKLAPEIDFDFRALSRHPNAWEEKEYGVTMIKNIEYDSRDDARGKWFSGLNFGDEKENICKVKEEIKQADLLVLGAGNFLLDKTIDLFRGPVPLLAVYVFLANVHHIPVLLYGFSAGPLNTEWGIDLSRWMVENSDIVTVRDNSSKEILDSILVKKTKIIVMPDATLGAYPVKNVNTGILLSSEGFVKKKKEVIALGIRDIAVVLNKEKTETAWNEIASWMNRSKEDFQFIFIPQSTYSEDDDRVTAEIFTDRLDSDVVYHIIKKRYHPKELIGIYQYCDATLAIRLHSAVFSSIANTPVVAINYHPKVAGFMDGIGFANYMIDKDAILADSLIEQFSRIKKDNADLKRILKSRIVNKNKEVIKYAEFALSLIK